MTTSTTGPNNDRFTRGASRLRRADAGSGKRRAARGFTLLELVLVMVIVCTVLAMAAPSLGGFFASRRTADAAAQIVALTGLARSQAIAQGRTYRLNLDTDAGAYWLTVQQGGAFGALGSEFGRRFSLPEGTVANWDEVTQAALSRHVEFYPDGTSQAATIRLTGRQGEVVEITCPSPTEPFEVGLPDEEGR